MKPRLFFGRRTVPDLVEVGVGYSDIGTAYTLLAKTVKLAPAGPSGECVFVALYLTVVHYATVTLRITPFIDGVAKPAEVVTLAGLSAAAGPFIESQRIVEVVEIGLSEPYIVGGVERLRTYHRGTWVEALVETQMDVLGSTYVRVDAIEVEHEVVVSPARAAGAVP